MQHDADLIAAHQMLEARLANFDAPGIASRVIASSVASLARVGGLGALTKEVCNRHAELRKSHTGDLPPGLRKQLGRKDAAAALLRKAIADVVQQLNFNASDGAQDGAPVSGAVAAVGAGEQLVARVDRALDAGALAALCESRPVVVPNFLRPEEAAALLDELRALDANAEGAASSEIRRRLSSASHAWGGGSIFSRSRTALFNRAAGRMFANMSADEATELGASALSSALHSLAALAAPLGEAVGARADAWWGADVQAASRGMIQCYPPGASYATHTDTHRVGEGWVSPRTFTALLYAHPGWRPGCGGELTVQPAGPDSPGADAMLAASAPPPAGSVAAEPRGGTLVLFPAYLKHSVAPVVGETRRAATLGLGGARAGGIRAHSFGRYVVNMWLSVGGRRLPRAGELGSLAALRTSTEWLDLLARFQRQEAEQHGALPPPGSIVAEFVYERAMNRGSAQQRDENQI